MLLRIRAVGRPAPEGSHDVGRRGQVLHQSPHLPAWRAAVKRACFEVYREVGLVRQDLPLFPAGVAVRFHSIALLVHPDSCRAEGTDEPIGPPDVDKLLRATIDGLGDGHIFANDSQIVHLGAVWKARPLAHEAPGAIINLYVPDKGERL